MARPVPNFAPLPWSYQHDAHWRKMVRAAEGRKPSDRSRTDETILFVDALVGAMDRELMETRKILVDMARREGNA